MNRVTPVALADDAITFEVGEDESMPPLQTESDEPAAVFDELLRIDEREFETGAAEADTEEAVANWELPVLPVEENGKPRISLDAAIDKVPENLKAVLADRLVANFREVITYRPQTRSDGSGATSKPSQ